MSNYDRIAISQRPDFYFSSNSSGDQSGTGLYGITNDATNVGQPIIVGNPSSWKITDADALEFDANIIFFKTDTTLEFVIQKLQPLETVCIFGDDDGFNGIYLNPAGVQVRFVDSELIQKSTSLNFTSWPEKMHVILSFDSVYCTLRVNDQSSQVSYTETDPDTIVSTSFKTVADNEYYIDGLGVYSRGFESKYKYVNAEKFDYLDFINKTYSASGTLFQGHRGQERKQITSGQFLLDPIQSDSYVYTIPFMMATDEPFTSISIESNYLDMEMEYSTNDVAWTDFTGNVSIVPSLDFFLLQIRVKAEDITRQFIINVFPMYDDRITTNTPAELVPNGGPLYPDTYGTSMVNFPEGVELREISYEGTWIEYIPNSIEILFMPKTNNTTIVFENADGSVSCGPGGSVTGFTAYLNGVLATDLDDCRINQWNHLVLTDASPTADTFYLNSDSSRDGEEIIEYALLCSYPSVLSLGTISQLYAILASYHKVSVAENPTDIDEGDHDDGSPFKIYTYAWAIVSGGGS